MSVNILNKIKLLKEEKVIIKTFTDKEMTKMIGAYDFRNYLNARNKVIIAMFVDTGIKLGRLLHSNRKNKSRKRGITHIDSNPLDYSFSFKWGVTNKLHPFIILEVNFHEV